MAIPRATNVRPTWGSMRSPTAMHPIPETNPIVSIVPVAAAAPRRHSAGSTPL